ncbi:DUF2225 domain-containing protein [Vallitalea maricola]|uniref:DUF2225 domain-containing protein n=1 Tax=Vallitalea maricola TaxID=3074433 RepID=A0ACB5URA0_9FIRM|nr:DUF2225 domain-containing protein [Vallitalea sp. AN17-2]
MSDIFSGLEKLGFNNIKAMDIFEDEKKKRAEMKIKKMSKISAKDLLYDRKVLCPVCGEKFITRTVRAGKAKLLSIDTDLRPKYDIITPYMYDVILCNCCGYAALSKFFKKITGTQADWIKKQISNTYRGREYPDEYTYEVAIERYKLALLNAVVKKVKASEKAYICLKIAWLYRCYSEELLQNENPSHELIEENHKYEMIFIEKAYEGFINTYENEDFPVCGMQEMTVMYLIGDLARKLGKLDESTKWVSKVIVSKTANERLKDKARNIKNLVKQQKRINARNNIEIDD